MVDRSLSPISFSHSAVFVFRPHICLTPKELSWNAAIVTVNHYPFPAVTSRNNCPKKDKKKKRQSFSVYSHDNRPESDISS